jgi:hypothetical protein
VMHVWPHDTGTLETESAARASQALNSLKARDITPRACSMVCAHV